MQNKQLCHKKNNFLYYFSATFLFYFSCSDFLTSTSPPISIHIVQPHHKPNVIKYFPWYTRGKSLWELICIVIWTCQWWMGHGCKQNYFLFVFVLILTLVVLLSLQWKEWMCNAFLYMIGVWGVIGWWKRLGWAVKLKEKKKRWRERAREREKNTAQQALIWNGEILVVFLLCQQLHSTKKGGGGGGVWEGWRGERGRMGIIRVIATVLLLCCEVGLRI